jgi:hypothetical protein
MIKEFVHKHFRCPFEIIGRQQKLIIDINLSTDPNQVFWSVRNAFQQFHSDTKFYGIIFKLPESSFESFTTFEKLRPQLVMYQAAILVAELDYRLFPFLPYQFANQSSNTALHAYTEGMIQRHPEKMEICNILIDTMKAHKFKYPTKYQDIVDWVTYHLNKGIREDNDDKTLILGFKNDPKLFISTSGISFGFEEIFKIDSKLNQNSFHIVRTPIYMKSFGRFAHSVEIVVTRQADFSKLALEDRYKIRKLSNTILKVSGVRIKDIEKEKQPGGLWEPLYKDK